MKQTAVEWLQQALMTKEDADNYNQWAFNKAKEMERRQKAEEYLNGFKDGKEYQIKLDELTFKSE